jgi:hypothetical protein
MLTLAAQFTMSVTGGNVVVFEDEIPAVETVLTPISDVVPGIPLTVFSRVGQQVTPAAAVDTDDRGSWLKFRHRI